MKIREQIKTRVAPSPTGFLHIGTARAALFNYLFAKQNNGKFILRIDDTDKERSKTEYTTNILESLDWLNLDYDEIYYQSERNILYQEQLEKLIKNGSAYISSEAIIKEGDRPEVIRFKNPKKIIKFNDDIRGEIEFDTTELGDFIIAKDLENPLYHFASVVDDIDLGITHIIRGEDHISNTPRQILMIEALEGDIPNYAHIPLILAPDRSKLSKRHGAVAVTEYAKEGYLPEAFINFMALLGWSPQASTERNKGTNEEIFQLSDLIEIFSLSGVQSSGAIFNIDKLNWLNKEHLKRKPVSEIYNLIKDKIPTSRLTPKQIDILCKILLEKISFIKEIDDILSSGEFDFIISLDQNEEPLSLNLIKNTEHIPDLINILSKIKEEEFTAEKIKNEVWDFATEKGRKEVLWPMRTALTGKEKSIDPFTAAELLGKERALRKLESALLIS